MANKVGRPKNIKSPEELYALFEEYKAQVKSSPKTKLIQGNKNFIISKEELEKPLTMAGFSVFCWKKNKSSEHYFANTDNSYEEFRSICSIIKKEIEDDQITGGMIGIYAPSITQRLNGLVDKKDVTAHVEQPLFGDE